MLLLLLEMFIFCDFFFSFQLEEEEEEEQEDKFDIYVSVKDPEKIGEAFFSFKSVFDRTISIHHSFY